MILFLDFDGVLHPKECARGEHFGCLQRLESLLREPACQHVRIVISSTWREAHTLAQLRRMFSPDIQAQVIGVTPCLTDKCIRYDEVRAYLDTQPAGTQWWAIDDDVEGFPASQQGRVIFTDPATGLAAGDVVKLRRLLANRR